MSSDHGFDWNPRNERSRRRDCASVINSAFCDTTIGTRRAEVVELQWLETGGDQPHGLSAFPFTPDRKASETVPILSEGRQDSRHGWLSRNLLTVLRFQFAALRQARFTLLHAAALRPINEQRLTAPMPFATPAAAAAGSARTPRAPCNARALLRGTETQKATQHNAEMWTPAQQCTVEVTLRCVRGTRAEPGCSWNCGVPQRRFTLLS